MLQRRLPRFCVYRHITGSAPKKASCLRSSNFKNLALSGSASRKLPGGIRLTWGTQGTATRMSRNGQNDGEDSGGSLIQKEKPIGALRLSRRGRSGEAFAFANATLALTPSDILLSAASALSRLGREAEKKLAPPQASSLLPPPPPNEKTPRFYLPVPAPGGRHHVHISIIPISILLFPRPPAPEPYKAIKSSHVRFGSRAPTVMVRLRLTNTEKIQFTQLLPLGSELRIGKERRCLRGLDQLHGPTFNPIRGNSIPYEPSRTPGGDLFRGPENGQPGEARSASPASPLLLPRGLIPDPRYPFSPPPLGGSEGPLTFNHPPTPSGVRRDPFIFKHDESLRAIIDLLPIRFPAACGNGKLNHFFHGERWWMNRERNSCFPFWWTMFPEKRFSFSHRGTSTTKIAIHTNLFTDPYALMGTGSFETGWFLTIMKLPSIRRIRIGFPSAFSGGLRSFLLKLAFDGSDWN